MKVLKEDMKGCPMELAELESFLRDAETGRLGMVTGDGKPYVVPLYFIYQRSRIYFHCAQEGKKLDCIKACPAVCFEADESIGIKADNSAPCKSTVYYRSVIAFGKARIVDSPAEKYEALRLLCEKYGEGPVAEMAEKSINATCVIAVDIDQASGKKHL